MPRDQVSKMQSVALYVNLTYASSLAYAELRIATAKLLRRFSFSEDSTMTEEDMEQLDCFNVAFKGSGPRVVVKAERWSDDLE